MDCCRNCRTKLEAFGKKINYEDAETIRTAFIDLCIYFLFLLVTTTFVTSTREVSMFHFKNFIERLFVERSTYNEHRYEFNFPNVVTVGDWWAYIETTFLECIFLFMPTNSTETVNPDAEGNILIGLPRLRQIRIRNETCIIHAAFRNQFRTCYGLYSEGNEDVSGFSNKTHLQHSELNSYSIWGRVTSYYGGGYMETLSLILDENREMLRNLKNATWVDRATRAILIEFALFNANTNLFCNVNLLAEIPPCGGIKTSSSIHPLQYSAIKTGYFERICALLFYLFVLYFTFLTVVRIIVIGCSFFRSIWNLLDVAVVLLGYISFIYLVWHRIYLDSILHKYTLDDPYFSLNIICYWNNFFLAAMSICVFIAWMKIFKYIKLNKTMLQFSTTIRRCRGDVFGFALMFAIVFIAYAGLSVVLFGTMHPDFRNFRSAVITMMRMVLGDFNYSEIEEANRVLAPIYFLSYVLFVFFILLNMFLAIINDTYSDVKAKITRGKGKNMKAYVLGLLKKLKNAIVRPKKDEESKDKLEESPPRSLKDENLTEEEKKEREKQFFDKYFEILSIPRTKKQDEELKQRITSLEQVLEKLVEYHDEILHKINSNSKKDR